MDKVGIQWAKLSYGLAMAVSIVGILTSTIGLIPYVGLIVVIPEMIIDFLFVRQMKNAVLAILDHREKQGPESKGK